MKSKSKTKDITTKPDNASPSKRTIAAYVVLLTSSGMLVLGGFAIWSLSSNSCDGTFNFKASGNQGVEFAYSKTNCNPVSQQQAQK